MTPRLLSLLLRYYLVTRQWQPCRGGSRPGPLACRGDICEEVEWRLRDHPLRIRGRPDCSSTSACPGVSRPAPAPSPPTPAPGADAPPLDRLAPGVSLLGCSSMSAYPGAPRPTIARSPPARASGVSPPHRDRLAP